MGTVVDVEIRPRGFSFSVCVCYYPLNVFGNSTRGLVFHVWSSKDGRGIVPLFMDV